MELMIKEKESTPTICLNMIVKNESHIIEKTLNNICDYIPITYWVISDTGSEDDTKSIITSFFNKKKINGELYDDVWNDFGHNRTIALQHAFNKTDYLFIFDADDSINGSLILPALTHDSYGFKFGNDFTYTRPLLINNRLKWKFIGVLHEYLSCASKTENQIIEGDYYIDSGKCGSRHKDPECYKNDAKILENEYWIEVANSNIEMARRYAFYCAQSYKDIGDLTNALKYYKQHVQYNGWVQEKFYSYLQIGYIQMNLKNTDEALNAFLAGYQICPTRSETLYELCKYYRIKGECELANLYYQLGHTIPFDSNGLFCNRDIYDYLFDYEFFVFYYYINNKAIYSDEKIHTILYKLLNKSYLLENILSNYKFYILCLSLLGNKYVLEVDTPTSFISSTPSIVKYDDIYYINIRLTNVLLKESSYYLQHQNEVTNNIMLKTNQAFDTIEKYEIENNDQLIEIDNPNQLFYGIQDLRLHHYDSKLHYIGTISSMINEEKIIQMCYGEYDIDDGTLTKTILQSPNERKCEKNWVLFNTIDTLYCIYEWYPLTIGVLNGNQFNTTKTIQTSPLFKRVRGSSCGYNIPSENEIWFVCHIISYEKERHYMHLIVILDSNTFEVKSISQPFKFENSPVEYCLGLIVEKNEIIMSYSTNDATSKIMVYDKNKLKKLKKFT